MFQKPISTLGLSASLWRYRYLTSKYQASNRGFYPPHRYSYFYPLFRCRHLRQCIPHEPHRKVDRIGINRWCNLFTNHGSADASGQQPAGRKSLSGIDSSFWKLDFGRFWSFFQLNIILLFASLAGGLLPIYLHWFANKTEREYKKAEERS